MNILEFMNNRIENPIERQITIKKLSAISSNMLGRACFQPDLRPGQSSSFLIYHLNEYFEKSNIEFLNYLEIGSLYGGSLCALYDSGFKGQAYSVDIFSGYYGKFDGVNHTPFPSGYEKSHSGHMQIVKDNVAKYGGVPICIVGNTQRQEFVDQIPGLGIKDLDVLYIDGDHSYKGAISDFNAFISFLKPGGTLLVDNFEMSGVKHAVKEITDNHSSIITPLGVWNNTTWIGTKK